MQSGKNAEEPHHSVGHAAAAAEIEFSKPMFPVDKTVTGASNILETCYRKTIQFRIV